MPITDHDFIEMKTDIAELKVTVASMSKDISEFRQSLTTNMDKISESMVMLASVSDKMNTNLEDHKVLHRRIDTITQEQSALATQLISMRLAHEVCQKDIQKKEQEENNSPFNKAKEKIIENSLLYGFMILMFILYMNFAGFLKFQKTGELPLPPAPQVHVVPQQSH